MSMLDQNNLLKQVLKSKMLSLDPEHNMFPTFHAFSTNATVLSDVFHTDGSCGLHYNTIRHLVIAANTDFSIKRLQANVNQRQFRAVGDFKFSFIPLETITFNKQ